MRYLIILAVVGVLMGSVTVFMSDIAQVANVLSSTNKFHNEQCRDLLNNLHARDFTADELVMVNTKLNNDSTDDLIVKINHPKFCGTEGCIHELCLIDEQEVVRTVPFGYAAKSIQTLKTSNDGLRDLLINESMTLVWDGLHYQPQE